VQQIQKHMQNLIHEISYSMHVLGRQAVLTVTPTPPPPEKLIGPRSIW